MKRCKQCGEERQPPVHEQYFGNWYCSNTAGCTYQEWKEQQMEKGYGRKKKHEYDPHTICAMVIML